MPKIEKKLMSLIREEETFIKREQQLRKVKTGT